MQKHKNKQKPFKLHISEGVLLDERLEEVASSTYATDSTQDIANWIVNKPNYGYTEEQISDFIDKNVMQLASI